jgi:hypothetical protein
MLHATSGLKGEDMRKAITLTLSVALLGIFAAVVVAAVGSSTDDGASTVPTVTTETERTTTAQDRPRQAGVDISGPCDEAEHANDPRCTGAGWAGRLDNSGPGSVNSGRDFDDHGRDDDFDGDGRDDDFDDHGGDEEFDDDSSGSGHGGGDDFDDDSSGSGHGGDDNSGRGGDDD